MKAIALKKFIPGIAWFFVVLYLMCLPGSQIPSIGWLNALYFDKWVHVGIFALLVLLFCWPLYNSSLTTKERVHYFFKIAVAASIWGLTTEFIQKFFVVGREFSLFDWLADSIGSLIAFWFCNKKFSNDD